jgi:hypothetical protein
VKEEAVEAEVTDVAAEDRVVETVVVAAGGDNFSNIIKLSNHQIIKLEYVTAKKIKA